MGEHQGPPRHRFKVRTPASPTCRPPCHRASRFFLSSIRVSTEGSCALQLAPRGTPCCQCLREQLCTFPGSSTGLLSGPWYLLNATLLLSSAPHANQLPNRNSHVSAKLSGERGRALAAARNAPPVPVTHRLHKRSGACIQSIRTLLLLCRPQFRTSSFSRLPSSFQAQFDESQDSGNLVPLACALNTCVTFESKLETVTCLCTLLPTRSSSCPAHSSAVPQIWTGHTTRQTHRRTSTTPHDVLPPQTCSQVRHGRRCQHHDQDHSVSDRGGSHSSACCS